MIITLSYLGADLTGRIYRELLRARSLKAVGKSVAVIIGCRYRGPQSSSSPIITVVSSSVSSKLRVSDALENSGAAFVMLRYRSCAIVVVQLRVVSVQV